LDASREVSREEKFDPLSQIERSKQIQVDQDATSETKTQEAVSVGQNLPGQTQGQGGEAGKTSSNNTRNGQTVNYEINSVRSERVREAGELKRITIAVVVDGAVDDKGQYQPRSREELSRLSDLIQAAVGFDVNRGDRVTVETLHFMPETPVGTAAETETAPFSQLPVVWIAAGGVAVLALAGGFMVLRTRNSARPASTGGQPEKAAASLALAGTEQRLGLAPPQGGGQPAALAASPNGIDEESASAFNRTAVGQKAMLTKLFEVVDNSPDEALATLRSWLAGNA
jgi:flagellar M-ring protein FliF